MLEHPSSFDPFIDQVLPFQAIRITKSRMSHSRIVLFDRFSRQSNTSAALLNIGMFNTIQDDSELRGAAYKLLQAVCTSLSYSGDLFLPSTGTLVPRECAEVFTNLFTSLVPKAAADLCAMNHWHPRGITRYDHDGVFDFASGLLHGFLEPSLARGNSPLHVC